MRPHEELFHRIKRDLSIDFVRGQWYAYNEVLGLLNTFEENLIPKKDIYKQVMAMRPKEKDEASI